MNTKEKIEVMQAYLDGKIIQFKDAKIDSTDDWRTIERYDGKYDDLDWMWGDFEYRIKSTPRVIYCKETNGTLEMKAFKSEDCGNIYCEDWIKFVEEIG